MINTIYFLRILNTIIAMLAVPASIVMFVQLTKESHIIPRLPKKLIAVNQILRMMFLSIAMGATLNALFSVALVIRPDHFGEIGEIAFNLRNLVINSFFTFSSWSFFAIRRIKRKA